MNAQTIKIIIFLCAIEALGACSGELLLRAEYRPTGQPGVQVESVVMQASYEASTDLMDLEVEIAKGRLMSATISNYRGPQGELATLQALLDTIIALQSWEPIQSATSTASIRELKETLNTLLKRSGITLPDKQKEGPL